MSVLNSEQIIKALECCVTDSCFSCPYDDVGVYSQCVPALLKDARALITSQEQRIKELTEENERLRAENVDCRLGFTLLEDAFKKLEKINTQLEEEKTLLESQYETMYDIIEVNIRAEIAECENSCDWCKGKVKADTVRKMQERLTKEFDRLHKSNFMTPEVRKWIIDQIAKEMLEENNAGS